MIIFFDLTALYDHLTGIERYAMNISKNVIFLHPENYYILAFKEEVHSFFLEFIGLSNIRIDVLPKKNKLIFQQWSLLKYLKHIEADYYCFLSFVSPFFFSKKGIVNTIHDLTPWDFPQSMKKKMALYGKITIKRAACNSQIIDTVSEFSMNRIIECLGVPKDKISVVYNGLSSQFIPCDSFDINHSTLKKYGINGNYLLCLSTLEPRKNIKLLIQAYLDLRKEQLINCKLVLAGRKGWKLEDALGVGEETVKDIIVTGFIDDEDLPVIYRGADAFVFPSLYEGFGIPIIEAMSQETVVISSNSSSLLEVGGKAALYFENNSLKDLKKTIIKLYSMSEKSKRKYINLGLKQCQKFNWSLEAEKYYNAINRI